jgi:hypothetical protein
MTEIRQLAARLHEVAWSAVRGPTADPWAGPAGTRAERRAGALQLLAVYSRLVKVLQRRIDLTIKDALDTGSDYGEIAAACGVSRQAIRQRWLRRTARPRWFEVPLPAPRPPSLAAGRPRRDDPGCAVWVRLAGGPHDGGRDVAVPGEVLVYQADGPCPGPPGSVPLLASYVPSEDDAGVYVFAGVEHDHRRPARAARQLPRSSGGPAARVYELAAEFGVESKVVMVKLMEMGEFVRSAASTVDRHVARRLREQFTAQEQGKPRTSGKAG